MEDTRYKTFWRRVGANFLDSLIIGFAIGAVMVPVFIIVVAESISTTGDETTFEPSRGAVALLVGAFVVAAIGAHAYTIGMLATKGQTVGKMATGIVVLDAATGGRIGFRQAFLRSLGEIVLQLGSLTVAAIAAMAGEDEDPVQLLNFLQSLTSWGWWIAEVLTMLTNERRRALHDLIAGTVVVKKSYVDLPAEPAFAAPPAGSGW